MNFFPLEILETISRNINLRSLIALSQICKNVHALLRHNISNHILKLETPHFYYDDQNYINAYRFKYRNGKEYKSNGQRIIYHSNRFKDIQFLVTATNKYYNIIYFNELDQYIRCKSYTSIVSLVKAVRHKNLTRTLLALPENHKGLETESIVVGDKFFIVPKVLDKQRLLTTREHYENILITRPGWIIEGLIWASQGANVYFYLHKHVELIKQNIDANQMNNVFFVSPADLPAKIDYLVANDGEFASKIAEIHPNLILQYTEDLSKKHLRYKYENGKFVLL